MATDIEPLDRSLANAINNEEGIDVVEAQELDNVDISYMITVRHDGTRYSITPNDDGTHEVQRDKRTTILQSGRADDIVRAVKND